jgi:hypothetical protein
MILYDPDNLTASDGRTAGVPLYCIHAGSFGERRVRLIPILSKGEWMTQAGVVCTLFYCPECRQVYTWEGIT